ncbi:hypothetical protein Z517_01056 [Fonsecaea pedrosoi CBS 271.37]|uniref:Uncharacterized protein n=1 Tax=Fonsecaea pedrosoi CBS 271.37 TaxID=1442368 RepID=A0A0D2HMH1_9EURO|nr:uncharacterized protein Z517_01056 [Fonsecaea pedrosoi CBS 271.37]KIW85664.1 hypothetical protein Z517_01056 [Fonsecaea pedrosoi CBS 271.37]
MALLMDETAYKLLWMAQWKLQQESEHMEPMLTRMVGHLSVYQRAAEYMESHDVSDTPTDSSDAFAPTPDADACCDQVADAIFGPEKDPPGEVVDEFSELLRHSSRGSSPPSEGGSVPPPADSVIVRTIEIDAAAAAAEGERNPFSDDEEVSSVGEDDINWSSDDETEFGSVSSFDEENEGDDHGEDELARRREILREKMGDVDMDPIWRHKVPSTSPQPQPQSPPPDFDGWARCFPPLARPGTPSPAIIHGVALVAS